MPSRAFRVSLDASLGEEGMILRANEGSVDIGGVEILELQNGENEDPQFHAKISAALK